MSEQPAMAAKLDNADMPAVFWDSLVDDNDNPDLLAIKAIQEESTPEERAETLKEQGNEQFKRGVQLKKKFFVQQAIVKYTEGLKINGLSNPEVVSTLLSNRAQAQLRLANNRSALNDASKALKADRCNVKAAFRGATAAERLGEYASAVQLCEEGLEADSSSADLAKLLQAVQAKAAAATKAKEQDKAKQMLLRAPSKRLAISLLKQGWQIGAPQLSIGVRKPYQDEAGTFHWPAVFMYPEVMQNDIVEDIRETDCLKDHLDCMFGLEAEPLAWDSNASYTRDRLEVYYLSYAATPLSVDRLTEALHTGWPAGFDEKGPEQYGKKATRPIRLDENLTIREILQRKDYIIPGLPVFFLLATGTSFREKFLDSI